LRFTIILKRATGLYRNHKLFIKNTNIVAFNFFLNNVMTTKANK